MKDWNGFKSDLRSQGLSEQSALTYTAALNYYLVYLEERNLGNEVLEVSQVMAYLGCLRNKGHAAKTVSLRLSAIKKYAAYNGGVPQIEKIKLASRGKSLPQGLLTKAELKMIYQSYPVSQLRKKILLGLIVFQALKKNELLRLQKVDIDLSQAMLRIKSEGKITGRLLPLEGVQLLALKAYLELESDPLVFGSAQLRSTLWDLTLQLRKQHPYFKNYHQLRGSVISEWIRAHGLRKAQYLAGHRYVSSTERYQATHLEELQKALDRYHPNAEK